MQRLARFTIQNENQQVIQLLSDYDELERILLRHLPSSVVSIFARPKVQGNVVEWYTELQGQPVLLSYRQLVDRQKLEQIRPHLLSRLKQIQLLNQDLQRKGGISAQHAQDLTHLVEWAKQSDVQIYLINNEPVITGWGLKSEAEIAVTPTEQFMQENKAKQQSKALYCCWFLLPFLLLLSVAVMMYCYFSSADKSTNQETSFWQKTLDFIGDVSFYSSETINWVSEKFEKDCAIEMPVGEQTQMVMMFDNSNSMLFSLLENKASIDQFIAKGMRWNDEEMQYMFRAPNRLNSAKDAASSVIKQIASNVDIGLVELRACPTALNHGYYASNQRETLNDKINAMYPDRYGVGGTPLYNGLQQASQMVDGKKRDAFILIISDGEDTCTSSNICALANEIAHQKPRLKINVVDIGGAQAANCVAEATNGKVFTAHSQKQVVNMINKAIKPFLQKETCKAR